MFTNPFSFDGRIRRKEFGFTYLIYMVIAVLVSVAVTMLDPTIGMIIAIIVYIPVIWFMLAQGSKRCHDRGNSGWYQLIPFYGFWMLFADSEIGSNQYGPNPKGIGNEEDDITKHLVG
jgi:uncharacterized membrane protein YhaH (DUF805 family)